MKYGSPFRCPKCGCSDFQADVEYNGSVLVRIDEEGKFVDFVEGSQTRLSEAAVGDILDDELTCLRCGFVMDIGEDE